MVFFLNTDVNLLQYVFLRLHPHTEQLDLNVFSSLHTCLGWRLLRHLGFAPSRLLSRSECVPGGHQMAPPDKEPQPKLLTAHASLDPLDDEGDEERKQGWPDY